MIVHHLAKKVLYQFELHERWIGEKKCLQNIRKYHTQVKLFQGIISKFEIAKT